MLTRLQVSNFKSLRSIDVKLGQLTVIVGPNGCGKSSVLQGLELFGNEDDLLMSLRLAGHRSRQASPDLPVDLKVHHGRAKDPAESSVLISSNPNLHYEGLDFIELYRFDRRVMEQASYSIEETPRLGPAGEDLAAVLDALRGRPDRFADLEEALGHMVPGFRRLRLKRVKLDVTNKVLVGEEYRQVKDKAIGHQVVFDFEHAEGISAADASEGTLLLLGLLTILVTHNGPLTLLLDDLDRALHPKAQQQLVQHLRQLLRERPDLQIIATSHSPYLVEHLEYEEVLAMTQSPKDGTSYIAPLLDHPEAERWREEMSAGEFWSSVGEDWVRESQTG